MSKKILFLSARPTDRKDIRVYAESKEIENIVNTTSLLTLVEKKEVFASDLESIIQNEQLPNIVHFSCHGEDNGILLLDRNHRAKLVSSDAIDNILLANKKLNIECIVLNVCHSDALAEVIFKYVDNVIGMSHAIRDETSKIFAAGFYKYLSQGKSYAEAFAYGCRQIEIPNSAERDVPIFLSKKNGICLFEDGTCEKILHRTKEIGLTQKDSRFDVETDDAYRNISYKGQWVFSSPDLWNCFLVVLNFAKQIHHLSQKMEITYLSWIDNTSNELQKKRNLTGSDANRLVSPWTVYIEWYNNEWLNIDSYKKDVAKAFNTFARSTKKQTEILTKAHSFYESILDNLKHYLNLHEKTMNMFEQNNILSAGLFLDIFNNARKRTDYTSLVVGLKDTAKILSVSSDDLLRKLISALLLQE